MVGTSKGFVAVDIVYKCEGQIYSDEVQGEGGDIKAQIGDEVEGFLDEIEAGGWPVREIGFTGGEPFMNPQILAMLEAALGRGHDIVPLIGARSRTRLNETLGALDVKLGEIEYDAIDKAVAEHGVAGTRYAAHQMDMLDSEKNA